MMGSSFSKHSKHGMPPFGMSSHGSMPPFMMGSSFSHSQGPQFGMSRGMPPFGMSSHGNMPPFMMGSSFSRSQGPQSGMYHGMPPMGRPPMNGPMGRPPMMGSPFMGGLPPIMPPISLSDYDYDASSEEGTPDLLSSILKQMMGGDVEITEVTSSSEGSSEESSDGSSDSVEVSVEALPKPTEIAWRNHGDGKDQRVPEEVSYRRAP